MNETVLVTGGTGYVGGWCIVELLRRGYVVRTTLRDRSKEAAVRAAVESAGVSADRLSVAVADLTRDEGWDAAASGCAYVLHVASPLGAQSGNDPATLVGPARDGTLRVLRAAVRAGAKRVVMTSAAAAARPPHRSDRVSDETVWADPDDPTFDAYRRSKVLAERAAWAMMATSGGTTTLTTILPGAVFGPVLRGQNHGSVQIIKRLLEGRPPGLLRLGFWIVDVRDLAAIHVDAMTAPDAAGQRFIAAGDFMWMEDIASTLRAKLGDRARKVPTRRLPDLVARAVAVFVPQLRSLTPMLGRRLGVATEKARRILGFSPRPGATTVVDCAESLVSSR